jgi:hypothetical protein
MKRRTLIVSAVILGQCGLGCVAAVAQQSSRCPTSDTGRKVNVVVEEQCCFGAGHLTHLVVTSPGKDHQMEACSGEDVEWTFENKTNFDLQLGVGHFRVADRYRDEDEMRDVPIELPASGRYNVSVAKQGKGALKCRIGKQTHPPQRDKGRTFKYDIIDYSRLLVLLDPELEIYP